MCVLYVYMYVCVFCVVCDCVCVCDHNAGSNLYAVSFNTLKHFELLLTESRILDRGREEG